MICPNCNSENVYIQQEWEEYLDCEGDWDEYSYWSCWCIDCGHEFSPDE